MHRENLEISEFFHHNAMIFRKCFESREFCNSQMSHSETTFMLHGFDGHPQRFNFWRTILIYIMPLRSPEMALLWNRHRHYHMLTRVFASALASQRVCPSTKPSFCPVYSANLRRVSSENNEPRVGNKHKRNTVLSPT